MSYRIGHHSTSDDSTRYRESSEIEGWKQHSPILRLKNYLIQKKWWSDHQEQDFTKHVRKEVLAALTRAENLKKPHLDKLFEDVYDDLTPALKEQKKELLDHLQKYPQNYPMDQHQ
eukprot:TRINITY_DN3780_c0_g1_i1.p1 TRINITY_DN3780_c0_g1~~TRINITY_DN3780_c0_g1_i1.p1  ORF type:complete len:116 (-),score=29.17 TRINITY_DN3780_c0_g1_i1:10-357(-)